MEQRKDGVFEEDMARTALRPPTHYCLRKPGLIPGCRPVRAPVILPSFPLIGYRVRVRHLAPWGENKAKVVNIVNFAGAGLTQGQYQSVIFVRTALPHKTKKTCVESRFLRERFSPFRAKQNMCTIKLAKIEDMDLA